ncbi:coiled-coil domain-containing protein 97-like [Patiria miniata]|uniref:CCD97-like C-terminal domain-containing protein n=1 Tax=Patiria miniata TaxID=46514 RepID=A0A913YWB7_PATMI|nr:coiled-coil domain-containing protein 97-like [Patiria miniata]
MAAYMRNSEQNDNVESESSTCTSRDEEMHTSKNIGDNAAARQSMFAHIAASKVLIKSQQRGEEDLSPKEKLSILSELLDHKPAIFLERFNTFLREEDLDLFKHLAGDYEIDFFLKQARKRLNAGKSLTGVRNRRYEALKKLEKEGTYFEDKAMKDRDPLMFEEYIGQYMTEEERKGLLKPIDHSDMRFSSILMTFMDEQEIKELHKRQKQEEDDMMEEEEEEEEDEEEDEDDSEDEGVYGASSSTRRQPGGAAKEWEPTPATEEEKAIMRQEFLNHMHQRFLSGQETDFDYSAVDSNVEYDSLVLRAQDEEEHYFDQEAAETWSLGSEERTDVENKDADCDFDEFAMADVENRTGGTLSGKTREGKFSMAPKEMNINTSTVKPEDMQT